MILRVIREFFKSKIGCLLSNLVIAFVLLMVARLIFIIYNYDRYTEYMTAGLVWNMFKGGMVFDLSALFYINSVYIVLYLFPIHYKETKTYYTILRYLFVILNSIALLANMVDTVYFRFTGRRSTATVLDEFSHESNLFKIFASEIMSNFLLVLLFAGLVWGLIKVYRMPAKYNFDSKIKYYISRLIILSIAIIMGIAAIRGGVDRTTRPITLSNANEYVDRPVEAAAVLNTPFSLIRSIGKPAFDLEPYMDEAEAQAIYSPIHRPASDRKFNKKNVVIFILESFSRGFIGALNKDLDNGTFKGYTPFVDSIIGESLTFKYSFANGTKSIDAMPSILSGIPMMIEPFVLTPASMNDLSGIAGELKKKGYNSSFFHGAPNGSMGFQSFANSCGFDNYYGMTEYNASTLHNGKKDFDGSWAIWDYPFFQFYLESINDFKQPFVTALFSATSHHPFAIPEEYKNRFPEEKGSEILKCIRYTDESLRAFFEKAKAQSWYNNTLFVITADHSNEPINQRFKTDQGIFAAPIIFYAPGDSTMRGMSDKVAQQIDIMPTILSYLGYDKPYVAFGRDLLTTTKDKTFAFSYMAGVYQYTTDKYFMRFNGEKTTAIFDYRKDPDLKHNIISTTRPETIAKMEKELKSFIQQYCERMKTNNLTIK